MPKHIVIKELGGEIDGLISRPIGFPQFEIGQESFMFLHKWDDGNWRVFEYMQGKYNLFSKRGKKMVQREDVDQDDVSLLGDVSASETIAQAVPLDYFLKRIHTTMKKK